MANGSAGRLTVAAGSTTEGLLAGALASNGASCESGRGALVLGSLLTVARLLFRRLLVGSSAGSGTGALLRAGAAGELVSTALRCFSITEGGGGVETPEATESLCTYVWEKSKIVSVSLLS